ncbi:MAG: ShlB/FhaC/HecB family hemolysin secretion/activation protein [Rhodanobacteraceae bacterium]
MPMLPYYTPPPAQVAAIQQPLAASPTAAAGSAPGSPTTDQRGQVGSVLRVRSHGYLYTVTGNHLLRPSEVDKALQGATDPRAAIGALKQAYQRHGYFLVALVGRTSGNDVQVRVVQGRLTHVEGPPALNRFFSGLKDNDTVKSSDVIRQSMLAQAYAATNGEQPQISFKPAPEFGGSTMEIGQQPLAKYSPFGGSLTFGNFGNRYAGHYLAQAQAYVRHHGYTLQVTHASALTGLDSNTSGAFYSATGATVAKVTPLGTFQVDYNFTRYQLGQAFAPLFPLGRIENYGGSGTQILYADDRTRWTLDEGVHHIHDSETVFNGIYTLRNQKYMVFNLDSDVSWRFGGLFKHPASLSAGAGVKLGADGGESGFVNGVGAPTPHFQIYTAHAGVTQSLAHDFSLAFDLSGQASHQTVPSYEQWVLGGLNNITAYLPGTVAGDRGYLGRLTLQGPQWQLGPVQMRPSVFAEHGAARYSYIAAHAPIWQGLTDAGAGLSFSAPAAHTTAMLAYAKPISANNVESSLLARQTAHVFFYLQMAL